MKVTLLDLVTGREEVSQYETLRPFDWEDNNWSCDCNRADDFDHSRDVERAYGPCVSLRYIVIKMEPMPGGHKIEEFNAHYPLAAQLISMEWYNWTAEMRQRMLQEYRRLYLPSGVPG